MNGTSFIDCISSWVFEHMVLSSFILEFAGLQFSISNFFQNIVDKWIFFPSSLSLIFSSPNTVLLHLKRLCKKNLLHFIVKHESCFERVKPKSRNASSNWLFQTRLNCLRPYGVRFSLHTFRGSSINPYGPLIFLVKMRLRHPFTRCLTRTVPLSIPSLRAEPYIFQFRHQLHA